MLLFCGAKIQIIFESSKLLESFLFIFSGAEEAKTIYFHSFSGAENEPRDIHPLQGLPRIWEGCNTEKCRNRHFDYVFFRHDSG